MSSTGCVGNNNAANSWQAAAGTQRPDRAQLAQRLFQQLDTSGQGYLSKADLQAAMDKVTLSNEGRAASSADSASGASTTSSVDALMAKLDTDGDGKVTEKEFADALSNAAPPMRGHHGHHAHGSQSATRGSDAGSQGGDHDGDGDDTAGATTAAGASATSTTDADNASTRALLQVMRMLRAYQAGNSDASQAQATGTTQAVATQGVSATA